MTQADLAEALDVSVQWVSRVELGQNLTLFTLAKIGRVLDVPIVKLFKEPAPEAQVVRRGRPPKAR
jgi:transcriptional regulator with XRE-family HTH domain